MYSRTFAAVLAGATAFASATIVSAADFPCPAPVQQTQDEIKGDIDGQAQTLFKIGAAQLKGAVQTSVVDLFSKYPNADKVAMLQDLLSTSCNLIKNSSMSDGEKFDRWMTIFPQVKSFFPDDKKT